MGQTLCPYFTREAHIERVIEETEALREERLDFLRVLSEKQNGVFERAKKAAQQPEVQRMPLTRVNHPVRLALMEWRDLNEQIENVSELVRDAEGTLGSLRGILLSQPRSRELDRLLSRSDMQMEQVLSDVDEANERGEALSSLHSGAVSARTRHTRGGQVGMGELQAFMAELLRQPQTDPALADPAAAAAASEPAVAVDPAVAVLGL